MAEHVAALEDYERAALATMAEYYGMTADEMAVALISMALESVVCGIVFDRASQPLEVHHVRQYH